MPSVFERRESVVRSYSRSYRVVFTRARGSILVDADDREYIDFLAGAGALNYGHNDPSMRAALMEYIAGDGLTHGLDMHTGAKARFLELFDELVLTPRGLDHRVQFTGPTGANSVEAALKLARKVTGRTNVIAFTNGFHGVSMGALAATGNSHHRGTAAPLLHGITRMPYDGYHGAGVDTAEMLATMLDDPSSGVDAPAAVILEVVQGEGGLNVASDDWLRRVADVARRHGALLIVDEIQTGVGRAGTFFAFESSGVVPDLVCLSKSISGFGLPLALLLIRPEHDQWQVGEHNGTFRGNQHAFVTAATALDVFWRDSALVDDVARRTDLVRASLSATADRLVDRLPRVRVKGRGLMSGIDVVDPLVAQEAQRIAFERGLVVERTGPRDEVVKVFAPLTTPDDLLADGMDRLTTSILEAADLAKAP